MLKKVGIVAAAMLAALVLTPIAAADPGTEEDAPCVLLWPVWEWEEKGCIRDLTNRAGIAAACAEGGYDIDPFGSPIVWVNPNTPYWYDCAITVIQ